MRKRVFIFLTAILLVILFMSGCAEKNETDYTRSLADLNHTVTEIVLENNKSQAAITVSDVALDQVFYGSFSRPDAREALVICRFLNMPHAGGLERRAMIILEMDSMVVAAYDEIPADEVWVDILPLSSGQDRIIFSGTTTYQGISVQSVMYFTHQEGQWEQTSVPELEIFGEDSFYFLTDGVMFVTSVREQIDPSHITAVLTWDQNTGEFIPEQTSDNLDVLSESEIAGFNTGFFNNGTSIMNNMLLNSEYSNPAEIDLFQLFYNGLGGASGQISAEELTLLTEMCSEAANLDVIKITRDEMEAFLRQSLGIELEKTKKTGLDKFYYLDEYDSYYNIVGDTRFEYCTVISGYWESEDKLRLRYVKESAEGEWEVTLQKISDGYLFIANEKLD